MGYFPDFSADFVILVVILSVLNLIGSHDQGISVALVLFPIKEINFFEQFLLMMFELSNHGVLLRRDGI